MVVRRVELLRLPSRQPLLLGERPEVRRGLVDRLGVERVGEPLGLEVAERRLDGRVRRAAGERADRRVQDIEAGVETLDVDERCEADRRVAVQLDRPLARRGGEVGRELADGRLRRIGRPDP